MILASLVHFDYLLYPIELGIQSTNDVFMTMLSPL
jgi:hypothetical protein